jgi:hypothetical protein
MLTIPIPVHPDDRDLPLSAVNIKLPSGKIAGFVLPIQGEKTIDNAIATLALWKATIVEQQSPDAIYTI